VYGGSGVTAVELWEGEQKGQQDRYGYKQSMGGVKPKQLSHLVHRGGRTFFRPVVEANSESLLPDKLH
jgi:hypothetical protein